MRRPSQIPAAEMTAPVRNNITERQSSAIQMTGHEDEHHHANEAQRAEKGALQIGISEAGGE